MSDKRYVASAWVLASIAAVIALGAAANSNVIAVGSSLLAMVLAIGSALDRREMARLRVERDRCADLARENAEFWRRISSENPDVRQVVLECWADTHADLADGVTEYVERTRGRRWGAW